MKAQTVIQVSLLLILVLLIGILMLQPKQQPQPPDPSSSETESKLRDELLALKEQLADIRREIQALHQQNAMEIAKLRKLVSGIPELETRMAIVTNASRDDRYRIQLDYVEWLAGDEAVEASGGDAPNGFYVRNTIDEQVSRVIDDNTHFYVLDDGGHRFVDAGEFLDYIENPIYRLFRVYEVNENILLIEEQYLP